MNDQPPSNPYVSRGGLKLSAALDEFALDVTNFHCVDLGCNVGGFTDCLLQNGATKIYAIDTGYGTLAWKLRNDDRVVVMERTNAMHVDVDALLTDDKPLDLAVIDLAWTRQKHAIPAAMLWNPKQIITLIKPHYELTEKLPKGAILEETQAVEVVEQVIEQMAAMGMQTINYIRSPIRGGKGKGKKGNVEYLALLKPSGA